MLSDTQIDDVGDSRRLYLSIGTDQLGNHAGYRSQVLLRLPWSMVASELKAADARVQTAPASRELGACVGGGRCRDIERCHC